MNAQHHTEFGETHFFVGRNFIVTVRHGSSLAYTDVRGRCKGKPHLLRKGPAFALYALMDHIVDQYFPVVEGLEQELDAIEEKIFGSVPSRETTEQIYQLKRELLEVRRAISPLIDICNKLVRFDLDLIPEDTRTYFRDIYDHTLRSNEMVDNNPRTAGDGPGSQFFVGFYFAERGGETVCGLGGDYRGVYHDYRRLWDEFSPYTGAGVGLWF